MHPPPRTDKLANTHICETAIWQFAIPLIFNLRDFPRGFVVEDLDLAVDYLLLAYHFDDVAGLKVHADRIAGVGYLVAETLDLFESGLETILNVR